MLFRSGITSSWQYKTIYLLHSLFGIINGKGVAARLGMYLGAKYLDNLEGKEWLRQIYNLLTLDCIDALFLLIEQLDAKLCIVRMTRDGLLKIKSFIMPNRAQSSQMAKNKIPIRNRPAVKSLRFLFCRLASRRINSSFFMGKCLPKLLKIWIE